MTLSPLLSKVGKNPGGKNTGGGLIMKLKEHMVLIDW